MPHAMRFLVLGDLNINVIKINKHFSPGSWVLDHGSWFIVPGSWVLESQVPNPRSSFWTMPETSSISKNFKNRRTYVTCVAYAVLPTFKQGLFTVILHPYYYGIIYRTRPLYHNFDPCKLTTIYQFSAEDGCASKIKLQFPKELAPFIINVISIITVFLFSIHSDKNYISLYCFTYVNRDVCMYFILHCSRYRPPCFLFINNMNLEAFKDDTLTTHINSLQAQSLNNTVALY